MSSILDRAVAHGAAKGSTLRRVDVPEWGGPIYYAPVVSVQDRNAIEKAQARGSCEAAVETLIRRSRDENGQPVFSRADLEKLRFHVDSGVLLRVAGEILAGSDEAVVTRDDARGN